VAGPFDIIPRFSEGKSMPSWIRCWMCVGWFAVASLSYSQVTIAGCWLNDEDGYRAFHHGQWFQPADVGQVGNDSRPAIATMSVSWIYEAGNFQPVAHPLPPPCQGSNCRSNPLDSTWQTIPYTTDNLRIPSNLAHSELSCITETFSSYYHPRDCEKSLHGFEDRLKRPPKI
jgi:hypothetical protein